MLPAQGTSMLPSILPGALLEVHPVDRETIRVGDILCYPGDGRTMIAHRIVGLAGEGGERVCIVRGDAQRTPVEVPIDGMASRVSRVCYPVGSYSVDGPVGSGLVATNRAPPSTSRIARVIASNE